MAKIGAKAKPSLPPVAPGTYSAICVHSLDIGEQLCTFKDKKNYNNQVMLVFELVGEFIEIDGQKQPRTLSRTFTYAKGERSGLRQFIESWHGRKYSTEEFAELDTNDLVGQEGMIGVVLNDTGEYANINTIMGLPKGMSAGTPVSPLIRFDMEPWDQAVFDSLPSWAQERIMKSTQWQKNHAPDTTIEVKDAPKAAGEECPI